MRIEGFVDEDDVEGIARRNVMNVWVENEANEALRVFTCVLAKSP